MGLVTLLHICGKLLNKLFLVLGEFILEKGGLSHSGHHIHWAAELQVAKEKKNRPHQPGTARYRVMGPGAVAERIFFFFCPPNIKSRSVCLYVIRWWGIVDAVERVN